MRNLIIAILFMVCSSNAYAQMCKHHKHCVERFVIFPDEPKYSDTSKFVKQIVAKQEKNNNKIKRCKSWEIISVIEYYGMNKYDTIVKPNLYNKECYKFYTTKH